MLADDSGVVVAGAGSWALCEEMAAYAPLVADGTMPRGVLANVTVHAFAIDGQRVYLCTRGLASGQKCDDAVEEAMRAVSRILSAKAA